MVAPVLRAVELHLPPPLPSSHPAGPRRQPRAAALQLCDCPSPPADFDKSRKRRYPWSSLPFHLTLDSRPAARDYTSRARPPLPIFPAYPRSLWPGPHFLRPPPAPLRPEAIPSPAPLPPSSTSSVLRLAFSGRRDATCSFQVSDSSEVLQLRKRTDGACVQD
ncbi:hypothetical protein K438DRAFT_1986822 [Mycena galopus ATCC 62051]|nr:hypothetical protein K438DRAFT_1986822 [Mycena galopus ATCC 62051]